MRNLKQVIAILSLIIIALLFVGCGGSTPIGATPTTANTQPHTNVTGTPAGDKIPTGTYGSVYTVEGGFKDGTSGSVQITPLSGSVRVNMEQYSVWNTDKTEILTKYRPAKDQTGPDGAGTSLYAIKLQLAGRGALDGLNFKAIDQQLTQLDTVADADSYSTNDLSPFNSYLTVGKTYTTNLVVEIVDASTSITLSYEVNGVPEALWSLPIKR